MAQQSGGCHCGSVKYSFDADALFAAHCQCTDCQKTGGGGHSSVFAVPEAAVNMTGELKEYSVTADSGSTVTRGFCPNCGTPISTTSSGMPGALILKAASLDNPGEFSPQMVIYTKSGQAWDDEVKNNMQTFEAMPPMG